MILTRSILTSSIATGYDDHDVSGKSLTRKYWSGEAFDSDSKEKNCRSITLCVFIKLTLKQRVMNVDVMRTKMESVFEFFVTSIARILRFFTAFFSHMTSQIVFIFIRSTATVRTRVHRAEFFFRI